MPIYLQVIEQIKRAVALGQLAAGDQLPTVKQLATELVINPNTAAKAYRDLEREGVIETFPGKGSFISARAASNASHDQLKKLTAEMRRLIRDAAALGNTPDDLIEEFTKEVRDCYGREESASSHPNRQSD